MTVLFVLGEAKLQGLIGVFVTNGMELFFVMLNSLRKIQLLNTSYCFCEFTL